MVTESAYIALDEVEGELAKCAAQVLDCIAKQEAATHATKGKETLQGSNVPGQDAK